MLAIPPISLFTIRIFNKAIAILIRIHQKTDRMIRIILAGQSKQGVFEIFNHYYLFKLHVQMSKFKIHINNYYLCIKNKCL